MPSTASARSVEEALEYMELEAAGQPIEGHEDRRRVHRLVHERPHLGPARSGAGREDRQGEAGRPRARRAGLAGRRSAGGGRGPARECSAAGFEWREPGCSMCLAMNPDKLKGNEICASSSSNRNFKGRQGSPTGRTLLMSPAMVAAAAIHGKVVDVREVGSSRAWHVTSTTDRPGSAAASRARRRHRHRPHHPGALHEAA